MTFYDAAKDTVVDATGYGEVTKAMRKLASSYGICEKTAYSRFRSMFGMTPGEYFRTTNTPSKIECDMALALSTDVNDFKRRLELKVPGHFIGLLDRYYGYSTFQKAKASLVAKVPIHAYNPTPDDNWSLFLSQYFGDGAYDHVRNSMRIEHGHKQRDYLLMKVGLFNKAWPTTPGIEGVRERVQGEHAKCPRYVSYVWNSNSNLPNKYRDRHKAFRDMTPFGVFLFYLDDGCYHVSSEGQHRISLAINSEETRVEAKEYFRTYGIEFTVRPKEIVLQDCVRVASFFNCFVRPFDHISPSVMGYKRSMKI